MSFIFRRLFGSTPTATMDAAKVKAQQLIDDNAVMVFSKSYCPYCNKAKSLFSSLDVEYKAIELDQVDDGSQVQLALYEISNQRTVPNIFIGGAHIGGSSDLDNVDKNGKDGKSLKELLKAANAL
ncbi:thioredoxin-like protein [Chaetomium sp. MPI-SDFR-AT-0129]|nr:thioredoxin-like protein [Chaetomium sp. MPI-SDFR-AT-0129]